ncbi:MAG: hypothetical protein HN764_00365 [Gammaproteobacteria bacterium]|jgi:hypothetical protein|nr:hypothetical protein [Gammaproteobacteria bacterium]
MVNVGCVLYKKGDASGTLNATWCHPYFGEGVIGTGLATGGPEEGYAGQYEIRYLDHKGVEIAVFDLDIKKVGDYYEILWIINEEVLATGIGLEQTDGLVAGWREVNDRPEK